MKKILTIILVLGTVLPAFAQRTSGGSTQSWRRYDVTYDTTYRTVTENITMPSTSKSYLRAGLLRGRGKWATPSRVGWPEWGRQDQGDTAGGDMSGGYELVFGNWENMTSVNSGLHPGIDLSFIWELGWQHYTYETSEDLPTNYSVEYGATNSFYYGLGIGATFKPLVFGMRDPTKAPEKMILIDIGATANFNFHNSGESTYQSGGVRALFNHEDDPIGMRINATLYAGLRYDFISVYVTYCTDLADIYNPEYVHESTSGSSFNFSETFEEDVDFNTISFGVGLNF